MRKNVVLFLLLSIWASKMTIAQTNGQGVLKNEEMGEMLRIVTLSQDLPFVSFNLTTVISDSANLTGSIADTVTGTYRQSGTRYWVMLDSVEYLQGFKYNLAVYHSEHLIAVGKPSIHPRSMQLSVLDSTFLQVHVSSMSVSEVDSINRSLKIVFASESPYSNYEMVYNKSTYQVKSIVYYLKNGYTRQDGTAGTAKIVTTFTNYSLDEFSQDYFREDKFVYRDSQGFKPDGLYESYQVIASSDDL